MKSAKNKHLPRMAWFAKINTNGKPQYLEFGRSVNVNEGFIFEGTFNGKFTQKGLINSNVCLGSGFVRNNTTPVFITPSHTLEGLFVIRKYQGLFVSNSNAIAYSLLVSEILTTLRTLSNEAKQYIHFRYTDATGQFDPVYDTGLVFTGKIDDYLGSMWQGKMGVV